MSQMPDFTNPYAAPAEAQVPELVHDAARRRDAGPVGLGGWLWLPAFGLVVTVIRIGYFYGVEMPVVLSPQVWNALTKPQGANYDPMWQPLLIMECVVNVILLVFAVTLLVQFFRKSPNFPPGYIAFRVVAMIVAALDLALVAQIRNLDPSVATGAGKELGQAVVGSAIWIPYFLNSKRVKNTFVAQPAAAVDDFTRMDERRLPPVAY